MSNLVTAYVCLVALIVFGVISGMSVTKAHADRIIAACVEVQK